jgi:hypothetical protein
VNVGDKIQCQAPHTKKANGHFGCFVCGGYGFIAECSVACDDCGRLALFRPGQFTVYVGKKFTSTDGLTVTYRTLIADRGKVGRVCEYCEEKE